MSTVQPKERQRFPGIDPIALQHPYDRAALTALQKVPGFDIAVRKFLEILPERIAYIQNIAQSIRVSSRQCPRLYSLLQEACAIIDVPEPELYIAQMPMVNAYTSGHDHPYIVLHSGLVDLLSDDEVLAVIAHELGHIKAGHVLYKTMARSIGVLLSILGDMTLGLGRVVGRSLEIAFLEWDRKSEFTADRSAALVVQDADVMVSVMMKLAGGTLMQRDQMDTKEFLKQADLYEEIDINALDRLYRLLMVTSVSHPLTVVRARESVNWCESREYRAILDGNYPHVPGSAPRNGKSNGYGPHNEATDQAKTIFCPHCGREQANRRFCSLCGSSIY
ncbi:M48 family metallopeptidase [Tengunoibacter tsumagoiensis]|uniref:Peptidase M48 domain-containing protein n=1 Tax=Tengunoibacter tsumagoiensis TaxID=2014871 RepID=A0A402A1M7_9CHLR|nr:M48 family metallopeptidase [Tengunoibacter tsumagoiensis]GCE12949.1 hypothetical protein KTT_28080 [Tengunoibacter tsumagoiensis]